MVDVGWFEHDLLRWSEFRDSVGHRCLVVATGVVEVFGRVAAEHGATLLFLPRQGRVPCIVASLKFTKTPALSGIW